MLWYPTPRRSCLVSGTVTAGGYSLFTAPLDIKIPAGRSSRSAAACHPYRVGHGARALHGDGGDGEVPHVIVQHVRHGRGAREPHWRHRRQAAHARHLNKNSLYCEDTDQCIRCDVSGLSGHDLIKAGVLALASMVMGTM
jgi:hypothetical protein